MQLAELHTFLAIVESGSLVRASEQLHVTQSTVTARLKSLESELGQTLINRRKSGVSMTPAGIKLHRYAATISGLWSQARQETAVADGRNDVCNLGCHPDLWSGFGEHVVDYIRQADPNLRLSVWAGSQAELVDWFDDGLIDVSLSYWPGTNQQQEIVLTIDDQLILVSSKKNSPIKFDPNYIFVEAGEEFGRDHAAAYADADTARISFNSARSGLEYLLKNGGSAYLPSRMVARALETKALHVLGDAPTFSRRAYMMVNRESSGDWSWLDADKIDVHVAAPNAHLSN